MLLGGILLYSSLYKIHSPAAFAHQIYNFKLLPVWAINPVAITLPWLQFISGGALILGLGTQGASALILLMMLTFQSAVASALLRGLNISCGCFESGGNPATWLSFGRDFLILLLAAVVFLRERKRATL